VNARTAIVALLFVACSAEHARVPPAAPAIETFATGHQPRALAVGDFDGDHRIDFVTANAGDDSITVFRGKERATFAGGKQPCDVDAVDVDRDGDVDLVLANHETDLFTVLLNDGKGSFAPMPGSPFATGAKDHLHSVTVGDFDGDGWVDVAVESPETHEVRIRRGGKNGFAEATGVDVGTMPYYILGSVDAGGEGITAILVPGHGDNTIRRILDHRVDILYRTTKQPWVVAAGRNGELAAILTDAVAIWRTGRSEVHEIPGATSLAWGDLDGDHIDDLVVGAWNSAQLTVIASRAGKRQLEACGRPVGLAITGGDIYASCATEDRVVVLRSPLK